MAAAVEDDAVRISSKNGGKVATRDGFLLLGCVVMPEHVPLVRSEKPSTVIEKLKLRLARKLRKGRPRLKRANPGHPPCCSDL